MTQDVNVESLVEEYRSLLGPVIATEGVAISDSDTQRFAVDLVKHGDWTEQGAAHLTRLAQDYGAFMLRNALALAIALDVAGDEAIDSDAAQAMVGAILDNLREAAVQDGMTVYWREESDPVGHDRRVMGSTVRTTAMVTDALVRLDPESSLLPGAVRWLMEQRQGRGWGDTQKTSYAILALTDYLVVSRELAAGTAFQVYLNGELWEEGVLGQAEVGQLITVPVTALLPAANSVQLVLGAAGEKPSGSFYYAAALSVNRWPADDIVPALQPHQRSIGIRRAYYLHGTNESTTKFRKGDLVEVEVTLDVPEESWYVVIDDPLPAGFEALNERLGTSSHVAGVYQEPNQYWERYGYNRKNVHDDRVSFFVTHLDPGQHTFTFDASGLASGTYFLRASVTGQGVEMRKLVLMR